MKIHPYLLATVLAVLVSSAPPTPATAQGPPTACATPAVSPESPTIAAPPSGLSSGRAGLLGVWEGDSNAQGGRAHVRLIVQQVLPDGRANGTLVWGGPGAPQPGAQPWQGDTLPDGRLLWTDWTTTFAFALQPEGHVQGSRLQNGNSDRVSITRCTL